MIDDLLGDLFGEAVFGRLSRSRRAQLLARLFFGFLGFALGAAGAVHFAAKTGLTSNVLLRGGLVFMFVGLACFFLFNVGLGRKWRWPGLLFILSFASLFPVRVLLGP